MVVNKQEHISYLLVVLVVVFVSCLMISNILANYMISILGYSFDGGTLLFPITYILSDIFSEVYGYRWSRRVTLLASAMNILFTIFIVIVVKMPTPTWFDSVYFKTALSSSPRIVVASIVSYYIGDYINDAVFEYMRKNNPDFSLFKVRAVISSVVGSLADTTIFVLVAFMFTMPAYDMPPMILFSVVSKIVYELAVLPLTCRLTEVVRCKECVGGI